MTRAAIALFVASLLNACSATSAPPSATLPSTPSFSAVAVTPSPTATAPPSLDIPLPSNACGGFHLKVVNQEAADVTVTINGTYSVTVTAGSSETIIEFLPEPKPPLPWTVVITTVSGAAIGSEHVIGPVDQKLTLSSGQVSTEPYDIRQDDC